MMPDLGGGGAQILQKRADDAVRAFIRHVGEQADHAQADDEADRRPSLLLGSMKFVR